MTLSGKQAVPRLAHHDPEDGVRPLYRGKVYAAGKILYDGDWRGALFGSQEDRRAGISRDGFTYVGPVFLQRPVEGGEDHDFVADRHLVGDVEDIGPAPGVPYLPHNPRGANTSRFVLASCLAWIDCADAVFAWIDGPAPYGTILEIGYARARGKPIFLGYQSIQDDYHGYDSINEALEIRADTWLARQAADYSVIVSDVRTAWFAFLGWWDRRNFYAAPKGGEE